jgi:YidC/Oxa1 family membrane protein insertase
VAAAQTQYQEIMKMDVIKTALIACIAIVLYYLLLQWPTQANSPEEAGEISSQMPMDSGSEAREIPSQIMIDSGSEDSLSLFETPATVALKTPETKTTLISTGRLFVVENDTLLMEVDGLSGRFVSSKLKFVKNSKNGESNLGIFGPTGENFYFANSGFFNKSQGYLQPGFTKINSYSGEDNSKIYELEGAASGLIFKRKIKMYPGKYYLEVEDFIEGGLPGVDVEVTPYVVIERSEEEVEEGGLAYTYLGPVFSTQEEKYEKYDFDDIDDANFKIQSPGGWASLIQHYFVSAWVPDQSKSYLYQARKNLSTGRYAIGYTSSSEFLGVNKGLVSSKNTLYVGPKLPEQLKTVHPDLDLVVDYGFLWWLGKPMYWLLNLGHDIFKNWGLAIIFLTVLLKIVTWPLSAAAYRSMGKMRVLAPKVKEIQDRHGDDKQKSGQAMMEFYKKEGVNPLGGCLPMLIQMPFFLAFYWVLMETVELRHSPFIFWIDDLSAMDPFFVLPLLNAAGMYYSQKLTPAPANADPMQAQMMKFFPLIFAVIFAFFPSGLVLYWLVNMLVTLFQQWWYYRKETKA